MPDGGQQGGAPNLEERGGNAALVHKEGPYRQHREFYQVSSFVCLFVCLQGEFNHDVTLTWLCRRHRDSLKKSLLIRGASQDEINVTLTRSTPLPFVNFILAIPFFSVPIEPEKTKGR